VFSLTLIGKDKNLIKRGSVFSEEVKNDNSSVNYVLMLASGHEGSNLEEIVLQETEQLVKNMFVSGEYLDVAKKNNINPDDIKKLLPLVILLINRKMISFTIVLIMKPEKGFRNIYIGYSGMGVCCKINSREVKVITPEEIDSKEVISEKLNKDDAFLLCSLEVADSLDNKFFQQAFNIFRDPEEFCKRIIFAAYNKAGVGNFSAAVFLEKHKTVWQRKKKILSKKAVVIGIVLLFVALGIAINTILTKPKDNTEISTKKEYYSPNNTPSVIIDKTPHKVIVPEMRSIPVKTSGSLHVKKINNNHNINFMINGSVVMVTNWSSVGKDVKSISWEPNQYSKSRIHKYSDYTQIPRTVAVTFTDNSTKVYRIKSNQ